MNRHVSFVVVWFAAAACGSEGEEFSGTLGSTREAIINGTAIAEAGSGVVRLPGCSGSLITNQTVLTADHCDSRVGDTVSMGNEQATVTAIHDHATLDASILELSAPMTMNGRTSGYRMRLRPTPLAHAEVVTCRGYGRSSYGGGFGTLRSADVAVTGISSEHYTFGRNAAGQVPWKGDSGSTCTDALGRAVGVAEYCMADGSTVYSCSYVRADLLEAWVMERVPQARRANHAASFSGDGRADLMFFEPYDAALWVSTSSGAGFGGAGSGRWVNPGHFGSAPGNYHPGDFNGDGLLDLGYFEAGDNTFHVALSSGSALGAAGSGRWVPQNWFGHAQGKYFVGDFDGDGRDDLAFFEPGDNSVHVNISTGSGFWGPGTGRWVAPNHFGSDARHYRTGDFNGDRRTDLLYTEVDNTVHVSLSTGSSFGGSGSGRWVDQNTFGGPYGGYYTGDFTGDGRTDLLFFEPHDNTLHVNVSTGSGFWGTGSGTWIPVNGFGWRKDHYYPADYNGDGLIDLGYLEADDSFHVAMSTGSSFAGGARWIDPQTYGGNWGRYLVTPAR